MDERGREEDLKLAAVVCEGRACWVRRSQRRTKPFDSSIGRYPETDFNAN
jgi:hypothetical protein